MFEFAAATAKRQHRAPQIVILQKQSHQQPFITLPTLFPGHEALVAGQCRQGNAHLPSFILHKAFHKSITSTIYC